VRTSTGSGGSKSTSLNGLGGDEPVPGAVVEGKRSFVLKKDNSREVG